MPKGGPDGGDGGRGGSIILRADPHVDNLTAFFYEPNIKAKNGQNGMGKQCFGKSAEDKIVAVPMGTLIYRLPRGSAQHRAGAFGRVRHGRLLHRFHQVARRRAGRAGAGTRSRRSMSRSSSWWRISPTTARSCVLCKGGKGGIGNVHFKSSRNRVPTQFTFGEEGEHGTFYLELRKIADVGLVGYPNAGKSTLLTKVSAARPKVAAYPFTTLTPHIGVVEMPGYRRYTVADIPGLIEGAHENVGLGHEFLRHIVRCKLLAFVIDMAGSKAAIPSPICAACARDRPLRPHALRTPLAHHREQDGPPGSGRAAQVLQAPLPQEGRNHRSFGFGKSRDRGTESAPRGTGGTRGGGGGGLKRP